MRVLRLLRGIFLGVFGLITLLHVTPVVPWINGWLTMTHRWEEPVPGDTLIVLAAEQQSDGIVGISSYWRTVYAVRAWRQGRCSRIVFSGGMSQGSPGSLASSMAFLARGLGVPPEIVVLEEKSTSTRENAMFVAALLKKDTPAGQRRPVLLTSDYHIRRAGMVFERAGLPVRTSPAPDVMKRWSDWGSRWDCMRTVGVELVKLSWYSYNHWI